MIAMNKDAQIIWQSITWYILISIAQLNKEVKMAAAKLFLNGRSQALRLPKALKVENWVE